MDPRPLGDYLQRWPELAAVSCAAEAVLVAAVLLELSRTLAERARGRWYAGNGRDLFHVGAAAAICAGFYAAGLPLPLCAALAVAACALPLLVLDSLPSRRPLRLALLVGLFVLGGAFPVLAPRLATEAGNALARAAFPLHR